MEVLRYRDLIMPDSFLTQKGHFPKLHRGIYQPFNGWQEDSYYLVMVSFNPRNPVFSCVFYVGSVDTEGMPSWQSRFFLNRDVEFDKHSLHYLAPVRLLHRNVDIDTLPPSKVTWPKEAQLLWRKDS